MRCIIFSNKFVTSVVVDGSVLSERADGQVAIPFNSEFGLKLTNKHARRAQVEVFIDEVSQGVFIVDGGRSWILCRGSDRDRAFKFVKSTSSEAKSAGKSKLPEGVSGLVKTVWQLERETIPYVPRWKNPNPWRNPYPWVPMPPVYGSAGNSPDAVIVRSSSDIENAGATYTMNASSTEVCIQSLSAHKLEQGVTVDGEATAQEFETIHFTPEGNETIHLIKLVGFDGPLPDIKSYCSNCGKKTEKKWRHCPFCSNRL